MPIDASIYQNLKPIEMPSMLDSQQKAMTLSNMGMQQQRMAQQMSQADKDQKHQEGVKRLHALGSAAMGLASMPDEEAAKVYPQIRAQLVSSGLVSDTDTPMEYEPERLKGYARQYMMTDEYRKQRLMEAQIAKTESEAKRGPKRDPMEMWLDKERHKEEAAARKKEEELTTNYGVARTADDAKKLKDAGEQKANFDRKLQEMIDLRKEFGGEAWNREAVGRGKQLSQDLLLLYKDLSKLGVLSISDEKILRDIIPHDPLEFSASRLAGQDPVMHKLTKFQGDVEADFKNKVANRVRGAGPMPAQQYAGETRSGDGLPGMKSASAGERKNQGLPPAPKPGAVEEDYVFMGGDPGDQKNWKKRK